MRVYQLRARATLGHAWVPCEEKMPPGKVYDSHVYYSIYKYIPGAVECHDRILVRVSVLDANAGELVDLAGLGGRFPRPEPGPTNRCLRTRGRLHRVAVVAFVAAGHEGLHRRGAAPARCGLQTALLKLICSALHSVSYRTRRSCIHTLLLAVALGCCYFWGGG